MVIHRVGLLWMIAAILFASPSFSQERRIALVIGIGNYEFSEPLKNPVNDAKAIAKVLRQLNFEVDEHHDLDAQSFTNTIREFGEKAAQADIAVVYYAGHGIQANGQNYLIPADAELKRQRDLVYESMPLALPLGEVSQARRLGILILDTCRNNPFVARIADSDGNRGSVSNGFARIDDTPSDTLVAMATRSNSLAADGAGENSPYAAALLKHLQTPGLELGLLFRKVRDTVLEETGGLQEPYIFGSFGAESFYFNPLPPNRPPEVQPVATLELLSGDPTPLGIAAPSDPDGDNLLVSIDSVPQGGQVRVGDRPIRPGETITAAELSLASFQADGSVSGNAGSLAFTVRDDQNGTAKGQVSVVIRLANRPPVAVATRVVTVARNGLGFELPQDPDGDALTVKVTALPAVGQVRDGERTVRVGDTLTPEALTGLTYLPSGAKPGEAGLFSVVIDDGRGGLSTSSAVIQVFDRPPSGDPEQMIWETVRDTSSPEVLQAFSRLFPNGSYSALAENRAEVLRSAASSGMGADQAAVDPGNSEGSPSTPIDTLEAVAGRFFTTNTANVREKPDSKSSRVSVLQSGEAIQVKGKVPGLNWYAVVTPKGAEGFVHGALIREAADLASASEAAPAPTAPPSSAAEPSAAASISSVGAGIPTVATEPIKEAEVPGSASGVTPHVSEVEAAVAPDLVAPAAADQDAAVEDTVPKQQAEAPGAPGGQVPPPAPGNELPSASVAPRREPGTPPAPGAASTSAPVELAMANPAQGEPGKAHIRTNGGAGAFRDCPECPVMMRVEAGSFTLGAKQGNPAEQPARGVSVPAPFAIGVYEVTVAEWRSCVESGGCERQPRMSGASDSTPVHNVTWEDAKAYTQWLSKKTGITYRLPSEAEWEYAAKGGREDLVRWGETEGAFANCKDCGGPYERLRPVPAGSFPPNPFSLHDMIGSVAEWTEDCWAPDHSGAGPDTAPRDETGCRKRTLKGGSWRNKREALTASTRWGYDQDVPYVENGFRVSRSLQ